MSVERCPCCQGSKKVMGLGCIYSECTECHGIGYVAIKDETVSDDIEPSVVGDVVRGRGRPAKSKDIRKEVDNG